MSDLDKLIEAVEAGGDNAWHGCGDVLGLRNGMAFTSAYNGSLDAAKALHDALLPGWTRDVDATAPECGITVTLHKPYSPHRSPDDMGTVSADMACEARAWLIAILKAYRSLQ